MGFPGIEQSTYFLPLYGHLGQLKVTVDHAYVLITKPTRQIGCDAQGNIVNTIHGASITSCIGGTETITIVNPVPGSYRIQIAAAGSSNTYTITFQTVDPSGKVLQTSKYSGTVIQGNPQSTFITVAGGGHIQIHGVVLISASTALGVIGLTRSKRGIKFVVNPTRSTRQLLQHLRK